MQTPIYVGLAVTSHDSAQVCEAVFSNVTITGSGGDQPWTAQDIGIPINDPQPIYVVLNQSAVVYHDDPNASLISQWTEWNILLERFTDQDLNLTNVNSLGIGVGDRRNPQPGGNGTVYIDDIRLFIPR